ncbi:hypothetical protein [Gottfriedia acidiceleris]|uniref:hypothetical protein n=1 Tax=Gottfriedia acidiceleris TaxID=371036 RepID=UPI003D1B490E
MPSEKVIEENVSSEELLWNKALQQIDNWVESEHKHEEMLLQLVDQLGERVKQNQSTLTEITQQFSKELLDWEKKSRVELLTATTSLQSLFPFKSYDEINNRFDDFWKKASEFINTPMENLMNASNPDHFLNLLEKFIEGERNNRNLFIKTLKETTTNIQSKQLLLLNLIRNQIENMVFPIQKYL